MTTKKYSLFVYLISNNSTCEGLKILIKNLLKTFPPFFIKYSLCYGQKNEK